MCAARRPDARKPPPGPAEWILPPLPKRHGAVLAVVGQVFQQLRVAASLWLHDQWWQPIHNEPNILNFEHDFGANLGRGAYNSVSLEKAVRERRRVHGEHRGFHDLFVPVPDGDRVDGALVTGPFLVREPTSSDVLDRWFELSGTQGQLGDPAFSRYLGMTLATLRFDAPQLGTFERLLDCYVQMIEGRRPADALAHEASALRAKLEGVRLPEQAWETARRLLHETVARPTAPLDHGQMAHLRLERTPQHVIVGLTIDRKDELDPVDAVIRRAAFQRAAARFAVKFGGVLCAQVGDHGVALLVDLPGVGSRTKNQLLELAARLASLARQFELRLGAGVFPAKLASSLQERYRGALSAAERALSRGQSLVYGEARAERAGRPLSALRADLGRILDLSNPIAPRFDAYIEAVLAHSGHRMEATRAALEAGLERLLEPISEAGLLDDALLELLLKALEQKSGEVRTVRELVAAYRQFVSETARSLASPTIARQNRGTVHAKEFIRDHLGENPSLDALARIAGFAPDYFARVFKREEGVSVGRYTQKLRIERAKNLLRETAMSIEHVRKLAGFRSRTHFYRAFHKSVGHTPTEYRDQR